MRVYHEVRQRPGTSSYTSPPDTRDTPSAASHERGDIISVAAALSERNFGDVALLNAETLLEASGGVRTLRASAHPGSERTGWS